MELLASEAAWNMEGLSIPSDTSDKIARVNPSHCLGIEWRIRSGNVFDAPVMRQVDQTPGGIIEIRGLRIVDASSVKAPAKIE